MVLKKATQGSACTEPPVEEVARLYQHDMFTEPRGCKVHSLQQFDQLTSSHCEAPRARSRVSTRPASHWKELQNLITCRTGLLEKPETSCSREMTSVGAAVGFELQELQRKMKREEAVQPL